MTAKHNLAAASAALMIALSPMPGWAQSGGAASGTSTGAGAGSAGSGGGSAEGSSLTNGGASGDTSPGGASGTTGAVGTNDPGGKQGIQHGPCDSVGQQAPANPGSVQNCD
jgi:hypothetical protein